MILMTIIFIIVTIGLLATIKIVKQNEVFIVERLGKYHKTLNPGLNIVIPGLDLVVAKIDIREMVLNFEPQPVITKDNVTMQIDTVVYARVRTPYDYQYSVGNASFALENLAATTLRNIIGELELDETLTSRELINTKMKTVLDDATKEWGMEVTRVEVKNIVPPRDIQEAMEKQMRAEREKREKVLTAEGNKIAQITEAEGYKDAKILTAEAEKKAKILQAEAIKESRKLIADGEADAILKVETANAEALQKLNENKPTEEVLQLKGYEAFEKMADGKASKLIIPSDMGNMASLSSAFTSVSEFNKEKNNIDKK